MTPGQTSTAGVAVIGCGWAGVRHADALAKTGASILWAVDSDMRRAEAVAAKHATARATTSYEAALADPAVAAVDICLPHNLHAEFAVRAAEAGKHVLVEKPLAHSLDEADRMIAACERAGVVLMVAENVRFEPALEKAAELIAQGVIGEPALVQVTREAYLRDSFMKERPWFLSADAAAGGMMMSGGVHDFDKLRMLAGGPCGEVTEVHARRARQRFHEMEGDDTSIATVRFENGALGVLVESFLMKSAATAAGPEVHTVRIDGDLGSLVVHNSRRVTFYTEATEWAGAPGEVPREHEVTVPAEDSFEREVAHFVQCMRTGEEPLTSGRRQRRPLELVFAAYESIRTGMPVSV